MSLVVKRSIAIPPGVSGAFDHGDVYLPSGEVFVAHTSQNTVDVLGNDGTVIEIIHGCLEGSGVLCAQEAAIVFAAARGAGKYLVLDATTHAVIREVSAGSRPNGLAWDPRRRRLLVADVEDFRARLTDPDSGLTVEEAQLPGRPRWCVYDADRDRFLVNIRDPACVVALAAETMSEIARIQISSAGPHGLDVDRRTRRSFVACDGGVVAVVDLTEDHEIARVPIGGVPDAIWFNDQRNRLYVAIGDPGVIEVVNAESLVVEERVQTEPGAHTTAYDATRQLLYAFLPNSCAAAIYAEL